MLSHYPLTLSKEGMTDKSLDEALDVVICNELSNELADLSSIQQEGSNLRYLEIYLSQLKKRLDMMELSKMQGTRMQGHGFVTLENIVA